MKKTVCVFLSFMLILSMSGFTSFAAENTQVHSSGSTLIATPVRRIELYKKSDWNSSAFRIPSLLRTNNNVLISAADIRFGGSADSPNNIDIGVRTSTNNGIGWSVPKIVHGFTDYPNQPTTRITDSASYIDSVLVQGTGNRVFLFTDAFRGGIGQAQSVASSGYTVINNRKYLILKDASSNSYTVRENNIVYDKTGKATDYTIGSDFTLYKKGTVVSNIFYKTSPLSVMPTSFIVMSYSDNNGQTWSTPKIMNAGIKTDDMKFLGVAPGIGITIKNGSYAGRILVPLYYTSTLHTTEYAVLLYSDDNGANWKIGESPNDGRTGGAAQTHESQIVEMPDGQIKMFCRTTAGKAAIATSFDGGATWDNNVAYDNTLVMPPNFGCQLSVINYSSNVNGYPAIAFCNPASSSRANGTIRIGLIKENGKYSNTGTIADGRTIYKIDWVSSKSITSGQFAYSCMAGLPNGNIAVLYEDTDTVSKSDHLLYDEYTLGSLMGSVLKSQ